MRRLSGLFAIAALAIAATFTAGAQAADPKPVAGIFEFESRIEGLDTRSLTEIFQASFLEAGTFRIVERAKLATVLKEQEMQLSGMTEGGAARIGAIAGATKVVLLSISKLGSRYIATAKCVDSNTGIIDVASTVGDPALDGIVALVPELAFKLAGKAPAKSGATSAPLLAFVNPRIGAAFDGPVFGDRGAGEIGKTNEMAFEGLRLVAERYRGAIEGDPAGARYGDAVRISFRETVPGGDYADTLRSLARDGNGLVFAMGFRFANSISAVAAEFPHTRFILVDGAPNGPSVPANLTSILFRENEGSFLAGALAALKTRGATSGKVGFLGGLNLPLIRKFRAGFVSGAAAADPAFRVQSAVQDAWAGSFTDPAAGERSAAGLFSSGVKVIYHAAGSTGAGAIRAALDAGCFVIGVDYDQGLEYASSRDPAERKAAAVILSSMVKRYDEAILRTTTALLSSGILPSGVISFGLLEGGVGLAVNAFNQDELAPFLPALHELERAVALGQIDVPNDDESLQRYLSALPRK